MTLEKIGRPRKRNFNVANPNVTPLLIDVSKAPTNNRMIDEKFPNNSTPDVGRKGGDGPGLLWDEGSELGRSQSDEGRSSGSEESSEYEDAKTERMRIRSKEGEPATGEVLSREDVKAMVWPPCLSFLLPSLSFSLRSLPGAGDFCVHAYHHVFFQIVIIHAILVVLMLCA